MSAQTANALVTRRPDSDSPGVTVNGQPIGKTAGMGGAFEGADRLGRELASWNPKIQTADGSLGRNDKLMLDGRGRDITRNSGQFQGTAAIHKDSIVGSQYRLNCKPNLRILRLDEVWSDEFQEEVEALFTAWFESDACWADATRTNRGTDLVRLGLGCFFTGGEVVGQMKYRSDRPFGTCLHMIDADRLSNPQDREDTQRLRRGVERDRDGAPIALWLRSSHPKDATIGAQPYKWDRYKIWSKFGRRQMLHILQQDRPEQSRGVADMVSILKEARMSKTFSAISLQNAIVQASYAAAIESELPAGMAFESIGAVDGGGAFANEAMSYLQAIAAYTRGGRNIEIDGVKVPHLFPGSKLKLMPAGTVGGIGQTFEDSLNRHISAGLGVSYEEFTNDFTKTNYSSFRGATNKTQRFMRSRKRLVADAVANAIYGAWLEEAIVNNRISSMPRNAPNFYEGLNREAYCQASWIGASTGQVDEMKETQAAVLRITNGLSTMEIECARLGNDYRDIFKQAAREKKQMEELGLEFRQEPTKPGTLSSERAVESEKDAAYKAGLIDQDGLDQNGNKPFDDGFGD